MIEIDGSYGEGSGQLVRTAAALAAITGTAVAITNVRAKRANPGLAAQHLTAVKAVATLCDAETDGLALKSQRLLFRPRRLRGGEFQFTRPVPCRKCVDASVRTRHFVKVPVYSTNINSLC